MENNKEMFCPLECGARINNLQKHIGKCRRKDELHVRYVLCEYNSAHIIKKELYDNHLILCENRPNDDDHISLEDNEEEEHYQYSKSIISNEEDDEHKIKESIEGDNVDCNIRQKEQINNTTNKKHYKQKPKILYEKEEDIDINSKTFFNTVYNE